MLPVHVTNSILSPTEVPHIVKYFNGASLILTENCNLACKYCYTVKSRQNCTMSEEVARKAIDFLVEGAKRNGDGKFHITYFGGEPLLNVPVLRSSFDYAVKVAKENNLQFDCMIITNCTMFPKEYKDFLLKWKNTLGHINVQLSIDGPPHIQDTNRVTIDGRSSSDVVEKTLRKYIDFASKHGIKLGDEIHVHSVISKATIPYLCEVYSYFRSFGFPGIWFMLVHEEDWDDNDFKIYREQLNKIADKIYHDCVNEKTLSYYTYCTSLSRCSANHPEKPCGAGYDFCTITPSGEIYPCHRFYSEFESERDEFRLGKLGDDYAAIDAKRQFFIDYKTTNLLGTKSCGTCNNFTCYRCIAANYAKTRNCLLVNPSYCTTSLILHDVKVSLARRLSEAGLLNNNMRLQCESDPQYRRNQVMGDNCAEHRSNIEQYVLDLSTTLKDTFTELDKFLQDLAARVAYLTEAVDRIESNQGLAMQVLTALSNLVVKMAEVQQGGLNKNNA